AAREALAELADEEHLAAPHGAEPRAQPRDTPQHDVAVVKDDAALVADDGEGAGARRARAVGQVPHAVTARELRRAWLQENPRRNERDDRDAERVREDRLGARDVGLLHLGRHELAELPVVRPIARPAARAERAAGQEA